MGIARFDNFSVHGANGFLLDASSGSEALLIEDQMDHLNLDGKPFMWGLLGDWQMVTNVQNQGRVLKGTRGTFGDAMAFRGERSWTDYFAQADVKLEPGAQAALCVRVQSVPTLSPYAPDYVRYQCYLSRGDQARIGLEKYWYSSGFGWHVTPLGEKSLTGFAAHDVFVSGNLAYMSRRSTTS